MRIVKRIALGLALISLVSAGSYVFAQQWVKREFVQYFNQINKDNPQLDIHYARMSVHPLFQGVTISDVTLSSKGQFPVYADQVIVHDLQTEEGRVLTDFECVGLQLVGNEKLNSFLESEGPIKCNLRMIVEILQDALDLKSLSLSIKGLGQFEIGIKLSGLNFNEYESLKDPTAFMAKQYKLVFHGMNFSFTNDGLFERTISAMAKEKKCSYSDILNEAKSHLAQMASKRQNPAEAQLVQSLKAFLNDPGSLTMTMTPLCHVTLGDITHNRSKLNEMLNMEITTSGKSTI